ncbi:MAG: cobalamin B12-binding domain-containing protein [Hyphomicrobium sp.]|nr:cobalamin B12-binding domain-containing protein [Hyphomicrobium sp.]
MSVAGFHAYGPRQRGLAVRGPRTLTGTSQNQRSATPRNTLECVIENTVVPRLVAHHASRAECDLQPEVAAFTTTILDADPTLARTHFGALIAQGHAIDHLFDNLLAPTAARLGLMWDSDQIDFLEVAHAMHRIQQIILSEATAFCADGSLSGVERHILLVTLPQERHRLALCLLRAHFWREGWSVDYREPKTMWDLQDLVRNQQYDALCISATRVADPAALSDTLHGIRKASHNNNLVIMAGGRAFDADPLLASKAGVDATAAGGRECIALLRRFFDGASAQIC